MCLQVSPVALELGGEYSHSRIETGSGRHLIIWYRIHLLRIRDLIMAIFLRNGDFKVVKRDDCNLI